MLEAEIRSLQRRLVRRDNEILKQERELHKLRVGDHKYSTVQYSTVQYRAPQTQGRCQLGLRLRKLLD